MALMQQESKIDSSYAAYTNAYPSPPRLSDAPLSLQSDPMLAGGFEGSLFSPLGQTFDQTAYAQFDANGTFTGWDDLTQWNDSAQGDGVTSHEFGEKIGSLLSGIIMDGFEIGGSGVGGGVGVASGQVGDVGDFKPTYDGALSTPALGPYQSPPLSTYNRSPSVSPLTLAVNHGDTQQYMPPPPMTHLPMNGGQSVTFGEGNFQNGWKTSSIGDQQQKPLHQVAPAYMWNAYAGSEYAYNPNATSRQDQQHTTNINSIYSSAGYPLYTTAPNPPMYDESIDGSYHQYNDFDADSTSNAEQEEPDKPLPQGPRIYRCRQSPDCNKAYGTGAGLRYHLRHFHKLTVLPRQAPVRIARIKPDFYECLKCGKRYSTAAGLRYHKKTFTHPY